MSSLIPPDLVTWVLGRDLMASDAEFVEKAIEVSFKVFTKKNFLYHLFKLVSPPSTASERGGGCQPAGATHVYSKCL
jgi:hypothetical protein